MKKSYRQRQQAYTKKLLILSDYSEPFTCTRSKAMNIFTWSLCEKLQVQFSSVTQLCSTLRPHESQHARLPCPSPTLRVHPNPCPLSR